MSGNRSPCWPRLGHESCSCYLGYGPQARLAIRVQELEERLGILEEELARLRAAGGRHPLAARFEEVRHGDS